MAHRSGGAAKVCIHKFPALQPNSVDKPSLMVFIRMISLILMSKTASYCSAMQ